MKRHEIWNNDVCDLFDALKEDREYDETVPDSEIWEEASELVWDYLGDEVSNLNKNLPGEVVLIGNKCRWNGTFSAYKQLGTNNLGKALEKAVQSFEGDNSFYIFCEGSRMLMTQTGHDNPTNPSMLEFRMLKPGKELYGKRRYQMLITEPLAEKCAEFYGWEAE